MINSLLLYYLLRISLFWLRFILNVEMNYKEMISKGQKIKRKQDRSESAIEVIRKTEKDKVL